MNSEEFKCWWKKLGCSSLFFDNALKGNLGMAGAGGVYFNSEGIKLKEYAWGINRKTNNGAEWLALIKGLELARKYGIKELLVFGDSCMVIGEAHKLMRNRKNPITMTHHLSKCTVNDYKAINFLHVLRENNNQADSMANKGVGLDCGDLLCDQHDYERNWIFL